MRLQPDGSTRSLKNLLQEARMAADQASLTRRVGTACPPCMVNGRSNSRLNLTLDPFVFAWVKV
ncbi:MAG: hypothetical protein HY848_18525 [Betaproteobacteria bacterium]|nr:hypothetical protein [Betaproteobacteria bacterium]